MVINKVDLSNQTELEIIVQSWKDRFPGSPVIPVSALRNFNLDILLNAIISKLPEGEPYFPKDQLTDKYERFFASEIIREKIMVNYQKEVPYSAEVEIESYKEENDLLRIRAVIHVARDTQKGIIIGHKGAKLKRQEPRPGTTWRNSSAERSFSNFMLRSQRTGGINHRISRGLDTDRIMETPDCS